MTTNCQADRPVSVPPGLTRRTVLGLGASWVLLASSEAGADGKAAGSGKLVLFDGKTLDGWKKTGFLHAGEVKIDAGAIVLGVGRPMTGITSTRTDLPRTDYELSYEARRLEGVDFFAAATFPVGKSYITLINGGWGGGVTGLSSLNGSDASENETNRSVEYRNNTWYRFRLRVTGRAIACWVDDKRLFAVDHSNVEVGTRIETRPNQPLGFATYESAGAIRSVEVRRLSPAEVADTNKVDGD
jgi:hypothetical protein